MTNKMKEITIRGIIVGQDWDSDNCPTEVSIQTAAGREVFVAEAEAGEELLDLEGAEVELTGVLDDSDPDYPSITVRDYEILHDPYDDEEEDEDEDQGEDAEDEADEDWDDDDDWEEEDEDDGDDEDDEDDEDDDDWEEEDEDDEDWEEEDEDDEEDDRQDA